MPSVRDPHKRGFHLYIDSYLYAKFRKYSQKNGCSMVTFLTNFIDELTRHITLTPEENEKVLQEIQKRIRKRS